MGLDSFEIDREDMFVFVDDENVIKNDKKKSIIARTNRTE